MTILTFPLNAENTTPQTIAAPGGIANASYLYIGFQSAPSAGTVLIEGQRPGATTWRTLYNGTAFGASAMCDGGYGPLRVTFTGLTGGSAPSLSIVPAQTVMFPSALYTDGGFGPNARLRVDPGQTGFFAGRMFRTFHEFNIAAGASLNILFQCPINFILWSQQIEIDQGAIKVENIINPTLDASAWTALLVIARNRMTEAPQPAYVSRVETGYGGNFTGGTVVDALRLRTNPNQGQSHSSNIVNGQDHERGLPAGNYIVKLSALSGVTEATLGTIHFDWEERP